MKISKEPECKKTPMRKNQKEWVNHFNKENVKMISTPDTYRVAKENKDKKLIESLKKDFDDNVEITSSRIKYAKNNLDAEIIHDADTIAKEKKYKLKIPILEGNFKKDVKTEKFLQALFDTKDSIDTILKVLKVYAGDREIRFWTPDQSSRRNKQVRSVDLFFGGFGRFDVSCDDWFDGCEGLSRRVIIDSAKQCKKVKSKCKK